MVLTTSPVSEMTLEGLRLQLHALRARWISVADRFERQRADLFEQNRRAAGLTSVIVTFRKAADELKEVMDGTWPGAIHDIPEHRH